MRKISKLLVLLSTAILTLATALLLAGCGTPKEPDAVITVADTFTLSLYEVKELEVSTENFDGEIELESSDTTIVKIDGKRLIGYNVGEATVTVKAGEKISRDVEVTVTPAAEAPAIHVPTTDCRIIIDETFDFKPVMKIGEAVVDATLSISVKDEAVVSYADGKLTALSVGKTTLTIGGTYFEKPVLPVEVSVTVIEDRVFEVDKENVVIYTYGNEDYKTQETIIVHVEERGEPVVNPAVVWTSADNTVATVENGVIKAVGEGETKITAVYEETELTIGVIVRKPLFVSETGVAEYDMNSTANSGEYVAFELGKNMSPDDVTAVKDDKDNVVEFSVSDGKLQLKKSTLKAGEGKLVVESEKYKVEYPVLMITKILYTADDVKAMMQLATVGYGYEKVDSAKVTHGQPEFYTGADGYFVMGANIDMQGEVVRLAYQTGKFKGVFDGRGHILSNIGSLNYKGTGMQVTNSTNGIFGQISGTVRNVAFVNVICGNDRYSVWADRSVALALRVLSGAVVENVFVSYQATLATGWGNGVFAILDNGNAIINNLVVERKNIPELQSCENDGVINGIGTSATVANTYGICNGFTATKQGIAYNNYTEMKKAGNDYSSFDNEYWDLTSGLPVFKALAEDMKKEKIAFVGSESTVQAGDILTLAADSKYLVAYKLSTEAAGVSIEGNLLKVAETVAHGTQITVVVYNELFPEVEATKVITVNNAKEGAKLTDVDLSLNKETWTISLTEHFTPVKATYNGIEIAADNYSVSEKTLNLKKAVIDEILKTKKYGEANLIMMGTDGTAYNIPLLLITKVLYTADDLVEMMDLATAGYDVALKMTATAGHETDVAAQLADRNFYQGADGYFVLGANIDFGYKTFRLTSEVSATGFIGVLDGRGHTISNINKLAYGNACHAMFGKIAGTIKNIGFINVIGTYSQWSGGGLWDRFPLIGSLYAGGVIENVYVKGERTQWMGSPWGNGAIGQYHGGTIENMIVEIADTVTDCGTEPNTAGGAIGQFNSTPEIGNIKNIYSICAYDVVGVGSGESYTNVKGYATAEAMKEANNDYASFNNEYWDLTSGIPVFVGCAAN